VETKPKFWTVAEVAEIARYSVDTVLRHIDAGLLPAGQPGGKEYRVADPDLRAYLAPVKPRTQTRRAS
jgi:excisionase family DNA binding protein